MAKAYLITCYHSIKNPATLAAYAKIAGPAMQAAGGRFLVRGIAGRRPTRTGSTSARWWWNSTASSAPSPRTTAPATRKRCAARQRRRARRCASSKASADYFVLTSSGLNEKTCGSSGSTIARTQCTYGEPKVSTRMKFS